MKPSDDPLAQASRNLLCDCAGLGPGDEVVICREPAEYGWYDADVARTVAAEAARIGLRVRSCDALPPGHAQPADIADLLARAANIIFFARIGDEGRFDAKEGGRRVMVYARNAAALASEFGRVPHQAMRGFKAAIDRVLGTAREIVITCPDGTRISGLAPENPQSPADTTTRRFPLGVPAPVPADRFSGRVALTDALTSTGNRPLDPPVLPLDGTVFAWVESGCITGFEGGSDDVRKIEAHYRAVADRFGIEPFTVHSWHAGIHPGCPFFGAAGQDREYWSNTVFSNPRMLHFHTCGRTAPGEISWNLIDASVVVDGTPLWDEGRLTPRAFPALAALLDTDPALGRLFA